MASYEKRENGWTVRFRQNGSNKRLSGYKTKKEAELAYFKESAINKPTGADITLEQLYELFKDYKRLRVKESSYICLVQAIRDYIIPYFGKKQVNKITSADILKWQNDINATPLKFCTKDRIYTNFVNLMNYAVKFHALPFNLVSKVGNFKSDEMKKEITFWTDEEFRRFIIEVDSLIYKAFFSLLYLTGARKGEALALQWVDVNLENAVININKTYTNKCLNGGYKLTTTKNKSSTREVIIPDTLIKLLVKLKNYYSQFEGFNNDCFVFGLSRPLSTTDLNRKKEYYCQKSGVRVIRFHDFRHSHASLLLNKEQNIMLVAQRLGHSDISMTLNTYSHLFPNKQRELMNTLDIELDKN